MVDDAMREYREALAEHERALAAVNAVRDQLERARAEYADARHTEQQTEQELQSAVAQIAVGLHELQVSESSAGAAGAAGPADALSTSINDSSSSSAAPVATPVMLAAAVTHASTNADGAAHVCVPLPPAITDSLVEYHRNIGCYHCYLFLADSAATATGVGGGASSSSNSDVYDRVDASALSVRVAFPRVELHRSVNAQTLDSLWWVTEIERNVEPASCIVSVQPDHIHVRLPVREGDKDVGGDAFSAFSQVTAHELDARHYRRIACRACGNELVRAGSTDEQITLADNADKTVPCVIERVLPLPSANWTDMFDFWGAGLGAFEHLPREDIFAQRTRVYVGESHVLLHADDTVRASLVASVASPSAETETEDSGERFWEPLACARCAAALGARHRENTQTIRLDKHVLASRAAVALPTDGDNPSDVFARYTVDSVVCAKLLEYADSDGVFRFTLRPAAPTTAESLNADAPASLTLQLLSWETQVKTTRAQAFRRVLKVLYAPADQRSESQVLPLPLPLPPAQDLVFAPAICAAVAARLHTSSQLLPPSLRAFNGMHVGYLYA